ncbi:MAG: NAD(P)H-dependent oxidoreductase subunit E [Bacteroidetes bacterium]|nr:NAD(P)H-dependent oxidoreductase subunit E [Bacteroidota bacterium]
MALRIQHKIFERDNQPVEFSKETLAKFRKLIGRYPEGRQKSALLPILHIAQEESGGHLRVDVMDFVADLLKIQPVEVYEVATFYTQFRLENTGKFLLEVCRTAPCAICGGEDIFEYLSEKLGITDGETTPDGLFTLQGVECLGACGYAPVMQVNTEFEENLTNEKIDRILSELRSKANVDKPKESKWAEKFC